jgi:hypothetical protein
MPACPESRCSRGWVTVDERYVDRVLPVDDSAPDAAQAILTARRAAIADAVYPCHSCQPAVFDRWAAGHYRSGHYCDLCSAARKR